MAQPLSATKPETRQSVPSIFQPPSGFADISLTINAPPTGGHVDASPRAGVAAVDTFVLECLDWTDEVDDLPLLFSFSYNNEVLERPPSANLLQ